MEPDKPTEDGNQGEGDRISARRSGRHAREFVAAGKVEPAAKRAVAYVEQPPEDAARAEREARRGPHSARVTVDELVARGQTVPERMWSLADRLAGRLARWFGRRPDRR